MNASGRSLAKTKARREIEMEDELRNAMRELVDVCDAAFAAHGKDDVEFNEAAHNARAAKAVERARALLEVAESKVAVHDDLSMMVAVKREELAEGREHLTVSGNFQSDKSPWCAAGFVPIKVTDSLARDLLEEYAKRHASIDSEFSRDLREALERTPAKPVTTASSE